MTNSEAFVAQDHLLPEEYVKTMREHSLDKCPVSSYEEVCKTFTEDLGALPEELFSTFEHEPFASASLAQVHRATTTDGKQLAVKVQHSGLREHCDVDVATIECAIFRSGNLLGFSVRQCGVM
jgi:aarF domain-containing kinase